MKGRRLGDTMARYPALSPYEGRYDVRDGARLEFYPQGESESPNPSRPVIEAPQNTSPDDMAGEMVSHDLARGVDPWLTDEYNSFAAGMDPNQRQILQEQYRWATDHEGERRSFDAWLKNTGQPAYFRGQLFHQWDDPRLYSPGQTQVFDKIRRRLGER